MNINDKIELNVIGKISTPHNTIENMPIQPVGAKGLEGIIELKPEYKDGLLHLDGFSDIILLYFFHKIDGYKLRLKPFMDDQEHGIFAIRAPKRPSPIGMSIVKLIKIEENKIYFEGADMLNGTPLIDIKPFFRQSDNRPNAISGWLDKKGENIAQTVKSDDRFKNA